jgi:hypothetical protein
MIFEKRHAQIPAILEAPCGVLEMKWNLERLAAEQSKEVLDTCCGWLCNAPPARMPCRMQRRMKPKAVMQNHAVASIYKGKEIEDRSCRNVDVDPESVASLVGQLEDEVNTSNPTDAPRPYETSHSESFRISVSS